MSGVPIACRDRLYVSFISCLKDTEGVARLRTEARAWVSRRPADSEYVLDRLPRFERVLKQWPRIRAMDDPLSKALNLGATLFNEGLFFDSHEFLEGAWRRSQGETKTMIQGIIQAAAGFHKFELGHPVGCVELLDRAAEKLSKTKSHRWGYFRDFAEYLQHTKEEVLSGSFDLRRTPKIEL